MVVLLTLDPDKLTGMYGGDNYFEFVGVMDAEVDIKLQLKVVQCRGKQPGLEDKIWSNMYNDNRVNCAILVDLQILQHDNCNFDDLRKCHYVGSLMFL